MLAAIRGKRDAESMSMTAQLDADTLESKGEADEIRRLLAAQPLSGSREWSTRHYIIVAMLNMMIVILCVMALLKVGG